jgi:hypothetical protein
MSRSLSRKDKKIIVERVVEENLREGVHIILVGKSPVTIRVEEPFITEVRTGKSFLIPEEYRI